MDAKVRPERSKVLKILGIATLAAGRGGFVAGHLDRQVHESHSEKPV